MDTGRNPVSPIFVTTTTLGVTELSEIIKEFMVVINSFVPVISAIMMALVTYWLVPVLKGRYSKQQLQSAYDMVKIAVKAAEQMKEVQTGEEKKLFTLTFLRNRGIAIDDKELNNMIESAVFELKKGLDVHD